MKLQQNKRSGQFSIFFSEKDLKKYGFQKGDNFIIREISEIFIKLEKIPNI